MYKKIKSSTTLFKVNSSVEGETIETKIERIVNENAPITDGAPIIWTERKDGVLPEYNIKTDRWDLAIDAMDVVAKTSLTKRQDAMKERDEKLNPKPEGSENGKAESTQGTKE